jgi:hypothetical protein
MIIAFALFRSIFMIIYLTPIRDCANASLISFVVLEVMRSMQIIVNLRNGKMMI